MTDIQVQDLPRPEVTIEDKIHERKVQMLNSQFPELDPLMCSVLLKCPPELMEKLKADPSMWVTPQASTHVLTDHVTVTDPEPELPSQENTPTSSPRSILNNVNFN